MAVECVIELASSPENTLDSDYTSDCEDTPVVLCNVQLTAAVRKQLAVSIRDLMQHGLMPVSTGVVLNCALYCTPVKCMVNVRAIAYITEYRCSLLLRSLFYCIVWNKEQLFPYTALTEWFFVTEI